MFAPVDISESSSASSHNFDQPTYSAWQENTELNAQNSNLNCLLKKINHN